MPKFIWGGPIIAALRLVTEGDALKGRRRYWAFYGITWRWFGFGVIRVVDVEARP